MAAMEKDIETGNAVAPETSDPVVARSSSDQQPEGGGGGEQPRRGEMSDPRQTGCAKLVTACQGPMNPRGRWMQGMIGANDDSANCDSEHPRQYRLKSSGSSTAGYRHRAVGVEYDPGDWMNKFLHWTFRTSFLNLFLVVTSAFFLFTTAWALLIFWVGLEKPDCIVVGGLNFDEAGSDFKDAFSLSWTTFSTVGYGLVYPSVGNKEKCIGIAFLTAFESFFGVLFAGFAGALVFGKVTRVQSYAEVAFSDPIVIRYGTGLLPPSDDVSESSHHPSQQIDPPSSSKQIPCPVLEFRVVNLLHNQRGGEIMNASINVVASTLESCAAPSVRNAARKDARRLASDSVQAMKLGLARASGLLGGMTKMAASAGWQKTNGRQPDAIPEGSPAGFPDQDSPESNRNADGLASPVTLAKNLRDHIIVDEEPSEGILPRQIFSKLEIETDSHPFFKRVWYIRHVLNEDSPLLHPDAAKLVRENNGFWPQELNNHRSVRENVNFHEIIVNLSGTANVSGASVYSQKVYDYVDANVGYTFAPIMKMDEDRKLVLDRILLSDVLVQRGGGAEPLTDVVEGDTDLLQAALGYTTQAFQTGADFSKNATEHVGRAAATGTQFAADIVQNKVPERSDEKGCKPSQ